MALVVIRMWSLFTVVNDERLFVCFTVESLWGVHGDVGDFPLMFHPGR